MERDLRAKAVSLKEFTEWVEKNKHRTWNHGDNHGDFFNRTLEIKYFYPSIDTRDMKVFYIKTSSNEFEVSHADDFDGTILELLEHKMDKLRKEQESESAIQS